MAELEQGTGLRTAGTRQYRGPDRTAWRLQSEGGTNSTGHGGQTKGCSKTRKGSNPKSASPETTESSSSTDSNSKPVNAAKTAPVANSRSTLGSSSSAGNLNSVYAHTAVSGLSGRVAAARTAATAAAGDEPKRTTGPSETSKSLLLFNESLLSRAVELVEGEPPGSDTSAGSSNSASTPVFCLPLPLPPVPADMAEAIKRQQKGAGNVRYWKTKHLQSGGGQPLSLRGGSSGGFQNPMFPFLKPSTVNHGHGLAVYGGGPSGTDRKNLRARERLLRQRGKENSLVDGRRGNNNNSSSNGHNNVHTQYMFGHSLGLPQPPAAYRRSVTTLETLLSLPFPTPSYLYSNPAQRLTQLSLLNPPNKLTASPDPKPASPRLCEQPQDSPDPEEGAQTDESKLLQQDQVDIASTDQYNDNTVTTMSELTCLQLADTLLNTETTDLSRFYQICQTKIRYVDFLERSALRNTDSSSHNPGVGLRDVDKQVSKPPKPAVPDSLRLTTAPRRNTWVPSLDSKEPKADGRRSVAAVETSSNRTEAGGGGGSGTVEGVGRAGVALPSIVSPGNGLTLSHGLPPTASSRTYLVSPLDDDPDSYASAEVTATLVPQAVSGKPILKPFNQDASVVKLQPHPHDAFFPSPLQTNPPGANYFNGALSVRGATMYPLTTEESRLGGSNPGRRRSHSSTARRNSDLRKRAVRFSISDQVFEFTPNEPVSP